jgi:hypothetical protein
MTEGERHSALCRSEECAARLSKCGAWELHVTENLPRPSPNQGLPPALRPTSMSPRTWLLKGPPLVLVSVSSQLRAGPRPGLRAPWQGPKFP